MPNELQAPKRYQCRHILTGGRRCAGPALKGEQLCYHHHTIRQPIDPIALRTRRARTVNFELPAPEDYTSIQHSLGEILSRLASHDLDHRRARVMLYSLHIASRNLHQNQPKSIEQEDEGEIVEEIIQHPTLGPLAPITELIRPKSFAAELLERLTIDSELNHTRELLAAARQELETTQQKLEATKQELETAQPTTLPALRAVAETATDPAAPYIDSGVWASSEARPHSSRSPQKRQSSRPRNRPYKMDCRDGLPRFAEG